ncbi:GTP-binding protein YPT1 [Entamoeba marina]
MKATTKILFVDGSFDNIYVSSVGVDFKTKLVRVGDKEVNLEIWDTAGQERFRSVASTYYRGSFGAIIVFDLTDKRSFEKVRYWVSEMKRELDKPYIVIVGNKTDLIEERAVNLNDIKQTFVNETYMECSAQSGKKCR